MLAITPPAIVIQIPRPSFAFEEVVEPHISEPVETEHVSEPSEEESYTSTYSHSSSSEEEEKPHTSIYHGTTYDENDERHVYYNTSNVWIYYWRWVSAANHGGYVECFDQNHNRTTCNRGSTTVQHNGVSYKASTPYADTNNQTVAYYQTHYDSNTGKPWYMCFDDGFSRITCNRKR